MLAAVLFVTLENVVGGKQYNLNRSFLVFFTLFLFFYNVPFNTITFHLLNCSPNSFLLSESTVCGTVSDETLGRPFISSALAEAKSRVDQAYKYTRDL